MKQSTTIGYSALLLLFLSLNPINGFLERNVRQTNRNFFGNIWQQSSGMLDGRKEYYQSAKLLPEQNKEFRDQEQISVSRRETRDFLDRARIQPENRRNVKNLADRENSRLNFNTRDERGREARDFTDRARIVKHRDFARISSERRESRRNLNTRSERNSSEKREDRNFIDRARIVDDRLQSENQIDSRENRRIVRESSRNFLENRNSRQNERNDLVRREARNFIDRARIVDTRYKSEDQIDSRKNQRFARESSRKWSVNRDSRQTERNYLVRGEARNFIDRARIVDDRLQSEVRVDSRENRRIARESSRNLSENRESRRHFATKTERKSEEARTLINRARIVENNQPETRIDSRRVQTSFRNTPFRREAQNSINRARIVENNNLERRVRDLSTRQQEALNRVARVSRDRLSEFVSREIQILDRRLTREKDSDPTRRLAHLSSKDENNNVVFTRQSTEGRRMATSFDADPTYIRQKSSALFNALQLVLISIFLVQIVGSSKTKRNWVYDFVTVTKEKVL